MEEQTPAAVPAKPKRQYKRGKGEGTIIKTKAGTWLAAMTIGYDANGKRQRKYIRGKTKEAVTQELTKLQNKVLEGTFVDTKSMTVGDLLDQWLKISAPERAQPTTLDRYEGLVTKHIKPQIGGTKLSKIKSLHIQTMLAKLEELGAGDETRRYCFQVLRRAFNVAIRWELIIRNPCSGVDEPKVVRREIQPLTIEQSQKLLEAVEETPNGAIFILAVTTGLRRGELFALHWADIDLQNGTMAVRFALEERKGDLRLKVPKSKAGRRALKLPEIAVNALWKQKADQLAAGLADSPIVFTNAEGEFLRKRNFEATTWRRVRNAAGIPTTVRFHDLRHTSASILFAQGIHPKIVQERLGHSKIGLTMDTYSHLMPGIQDPAAKEMDTALKVVRKSESA